MSPSYSPLPPSGGGTESAPPGAHRVVDVVEALAGGKGVVGVDALEPAHRQEHPDGRAEGKKGLGPEHQLGVVDGHLGGREGERGTIRE